MTDFLLELLSEEIPARMQEKAQADLARLFEAEIAKAGLKAEVVETYATPRRLALIARGLPEATQATASETKGPRASGPSQALEGFLRKTGLMRNALVERDGVLFAIVQTPGRATADVLAEAIPPLVRAFPWPKSMRWGAGSASTASLRWVRPLHGIVALLGEAVVPFEVDGIASGAATVGHRFHHPGPITIGSADDYAFKLRAAHVILDPAERRGIIEGGARALAERQGLHVVPDAGLVAENAGLTEWPVPLLGAFDPAFLEVPREVIQLTMRTNQKYFACVDGEGRLAPVFICTANVAASDGGAGIVAGNRKVLAARLSDARFFWEQDLKVPLEEQRKKLDRIVFHEKLGTVAEKVARVAKLARWLVEEGIIPLPAGERGGPAGEAGGGVRARDNAALTSSRAPSPSHASGAGPSLSLNGRGDYADMAEQAALLCKADLVTGMVGEFPELQGIMGGYYARAEGLPHQVADAIRDHYKPVGQGDEVPTAPVTVAVSLADKLDTLLSFFAVGERPTGSKDPFALRRAAIGIIALLLESGMRMKATEVEQAARDILLRQFARKIEQIGPSFAQGEGGSMILQQQDGGTVATFSFMYKDDEKVVGAEAETIKQLMQIMSLVVNYPFDVSDFLADRLKVQQREAGVRHDLIDAVFALGGEDDLVRLLARVKALQAFVGGEDGANLLAGYKRAANILKKEGWEQGPVAPAEAGAHSADDAGAAPGGEGMGPRLRGGDEGGYALEPAEAALIAALDLAEPEAERAVAEERFADAMAALATLRGPIDAFFEQVTVNDPVPAKRAARLALLARIRDAVHRVADFSKIEG